MQSVSPSPDRFRRSIFRRDSVLAVALVLAAFAFVFWRSIAFVYVEGDDAQIVAHHAMGGDATVEPVYSAYESMFDAVLALLPPREDVIRITALGLTAACAPLLFSLMLLLAFDWSEEWPNHRAASAAVMLLAVPEFYYLGMVLTPIFVAMTLIVAAHLLLRHSRHWTGRRRWYAFASSAIVFGIGAAFRWDTVLYGATVAADFTFGGSSAHRQPEIGRRFAIVAGWGTLAAAVWLVVLDWNGYSPTMVVTTISRAGPAESFNLLLGLSRIQTLFTPLFSALCVTGLWVLLKRRHPLALTAIVSLAAVGNLALYGVPKWMITAIPSLFALATVGVSTAWQRPPARYAVIALAVLPWIVGVRMTYEGTAWGPGFEMQRYDSRAPATSRPWLTFGAGSAVPTPEGPRPLFGHAWVLGGEWKRFVNRYWQEQQSALDAAIRRNVPVLIQDYNQGWGVDVYLTRGFKSADSAFRTIDDRFVVERRWRRADGTTSRMLYLPPGSDLTDESTAARLQQTSGASIVVMAFSSTLARIHELVPQSLEPLGNTTAVLHPDRLAARAVQADVFH